MYSLYFTVYSELSIVYWEKDRTVFLACILGTGVFLLIVSNQSSAKGKGEIIIKILFSFLILLTKVDTK